jgi:hypothetical protein
VSRLDPVPYTLTPQAEEELALADEAEADWAAEWDDADSNAYQARVEAGLEPEAGRVMPQITMAESAADLEP